MVCWGPVETAPAVSAEHIRQARAFRHTDRGHTFARHALTGTTSGARGLMGTMAREILGMSSDAPDWAIDRLADAFWNETA
jgi:hypothetical protein